MDIKEILSNIKQIRNTLQFENDSPSGAIQDTIWMMHGNETLFDFIDNLISKIEQ